MASNAVQLSFTTEGLREAEAMLRGIPRGMPLALAGAINETLKETETATSKAVRAKVYIKRKDLDPYLHVRKAKPSANPAGQFTIEESERIGLGYWGARQTKKGVSYRIGKDRPRDFIRSAFGPEIARLGHQVWQRVSKKRLPIERVGAGPSAWGVVVKNKIDVKAAIDARASLDKNLKQRIDFYIKRHAGQIAGYGAGGVPLKASGGIA